MKTKMYAARRATAMFALPTFTALAVNPHPIAPATVTPNLSPHFEPWYWFTAGIGITVRVPQRRLRLRRRTGRVSG